MNIHTQLLGEARLGPATGAEPSREERLTESVSNDMISNGTSRGRYAKYIATHWSNYNTWLERTRLEEERRQRTQEEGSTLRNLLRDHTRLVQ